MRFFAATSFLLSYAAAALGAVTWSTDPFNPAAVPLAVRSPYLSAWLSQGAGTALCDAWPTFWTGSVSYASRHAYAAVVCNFNPFLDPGMGGFGEGRRPSLHMDGNPRHSQRQREQSDAKELAGGYRRVYRTCGLHLLGEQFTSTQSVFVMTTGPVDLTITFLSPVEVLGAYSPTRGRSHKITIAFRLRQPVSPPLLLLCFRGIKRRQVPYRAGICGYQRRMGQRRQHSHCQLGHHDW